MKWVCRKMTTDLEPSRFMHAVERVSGGEHPHHNSARLFADELDDDLADELGDGAAQLVPDERLERLPADAATL
jgi:hypothetical protein